MREIIHFASPEDCIRLFKLFPNETWPTVMFIFSKTPPPCPYCSSPDEAIRETYFDQNCRGCVKRMGPA